MKRRDALKALIMAPAAPAVIAKAVQSTPAISVIVPVPKTWKWHSMQELTDFENVIREHILSNGDHLDRFKKVSL